MSAYSDRAWREELRVGINMGKKTQHKETFKGQGGVACNNRRPRDKETPPPTPASLPMLPLGARSQGCRRGLGAHCPAAQGEYKVQPTCHKGPACWDSTRPAPAPGPVPTQEGSARCWRTDNETCLYVRSDPIRQQQNMTPTEGQPGIPTPPDRRTGAPGRGERSQPTPP